MGACKVRLKTQLPELGQASENFGFGEEMAWAVADPVYFAESAYVSGVSEDAA